MVELHDELVLDFELLLLVDSPGVFVEEQLLLLEWSPIGVSHPVSAA